MIKDRRLSGCDIPLQRIELDLDLIPVKRRARAD
jgi:hypothetical protein